MSNPARNKQCVHCAHCLKSTNYCTRFQFALVRKAGSPYDKHNCIGFVEGTYAGQEKGDRDEAQAENA